MYHVLVVTAAPLSVTSLHTFEVLWIPISTMCLTPPIQGFGYGVMEPYISISLLVAFGEEVDDPPRAFGLQHHRLQPHL
jgi:hypothetical protein